MPIPKPKTQDTQEEFIDRCMNDETMEKDFEDNDQRLAVCFDEWSKRTDKRGRQVRTNFFQEEIEFRLLEEKNTIEGYAAKFNKRSQDLGGFTEVIRPGAFKKTLQEADVRVLMNHDSNLVLGRNKSGTAKLWEDEIGLRFSVELPNTTYANDLKEVMKRGDVTQCSFGFIPIKENWSQDYTEREIKEVRLFDASVVTYPAYEDTEAQLRNLQTEKNNAIKKRIGEKEFEYIKNNILEELRNESHEVKAETHSEPDKRNLSENRARNIKSKIFSVLEE